MLISDSLARLVMPPARFEITVEKLHHRRADSGARELGRLRWGLVPGRWAEKRSGPPLINARAEALPTQPAFAESFRERRCLIPADGFYEWRKDEGGKVPIWLSRPDGDLFAFAGVWAALPSRDTPPAPRPGARPCARMVSTRQAAPAIPSTKSLRGRS